MLGVPGVPDFEIPNSEFRMAYGPVREILARGRKCRTSSVSPGRTLGVLWGGGRKGRKEGNRVDTGYGQQKAPRGNLGDAKREFGRLVNRCRLGLREPSGTRRKRQGGDTQGLGIGRSPELPSVHNFKAQTKGTEFALNYRAVFIGAVGAEHLHRYVLFTLASGELHGPPIVQNHTAVRVATEHGATHGGLECVPLNEI